MNIVTLRAKAERGWISARASLPLALLFRYRNNKPYCKDLSHAVPIGEGERGAWAERVAEDYLHGKGIKTLARNYSCKFGEIDLILGENTNDGDMTVIFAEVRFRSNPRFGTGAESVDYRKRQRIIMAARHYLQQNPMLRDKPCRFDIVSISPRQQNGNDHIRWIPAAFEA
uniref:UPF0102 protein BECKUNK1418G_GA0071005_100310 n=1 Tax=Candidatus Kentrum sp. UNK TaxID=2126344 RepID=A0A451AS90_9GAMM|nr:MAG: putative endonuclease [Candidatus Kentron sp. UNK]VFK68857.1 MAG: putative endonuclease [Candidatus Kentron sp. UNK]